jgi:aerobic-type carbon monoxide dehydrogenase small subunit (CoxS/CutS family)
MSTISLKVNGRLHTLELDPATPLLFVLSDELELRARSSGAECIWSFGAALPALLFYGDLP